MKRVVRAIDMSDALIVLGLAAAAGGVAWIDWRGLIVFFGLLMMLAGLARAR